MHKLIGEILSELKAIIHALANNIEKKYGSIFKAGIVLIGLALAGISQTFPVLIEYDFKGKEILIDFAAQQNKHIDDVDCDILETRNTAKCKFAKYTQSLHKFRRQVSQAADFRISR